MRKKRGLLFILDGLGDRPNKVLEGMTPLEKAHTPNMEKLVRNGSCGNVYPIAPGLPVGTDVGHLHIFGQDSRKIYSGRGPLEAISAGIELVDGDIAFRGNFGTVSEDYTVIDRRAGRIRENTAELAKALNGMVLSDGCTVLAKELTEHRVAIVLRAPGLDDKIECTDPGTAEEGKKLIVPYAFDENDRASKKCAQYLQEFTEKSYEILNNHPINIEREKQGLLKANVVITRGAGRNRAIPSLTAIYPVKGACVAGDHTVTGIAQILGMDGYYEPSFTGSFDTNIEGKIKLACSLVNSGKYDWVVTHFKATDLAGHDSLPLEKCKFIEKFDTHLGYVFDNIDMDECYVSITGDHSTPCDIRDHTGDPVPTIISGADVRKDGITQVGETHFYKGSLQSITANDIFMLQMNYMGFVKKVGS